jgi:predicted phage terminase large subunit-like protein
MAELLGATSLSTGGAIDLALRAVLNPKQLEAWELLAGPATHICLVGGARSGKTFTLVLAVVLRAMLYPNSRHAIFRLRNNSAKASIWLDTLPTVLRRFFPGVSPEPHVQEGYLKFPNGSEIWIAGLDDKERVEKILGQEFATIYFNECSQIPFSSVRLALTRLAQNIPGLRQKAYYDINPTGIGHWSNQQFGLHKNPDTNKPLEDPEQYARMFINPVDNARNLTERYMKSLQTGSEADVRRFWLGEYSAEAAGALWTYARLEMIRVEEAEVPVMSRIVVAVDPSGCKGPEDTRSDEIGIVVAGKGVDGRAYVVADLSGRFGPAEWASRVVQAYRVYGADCIVAETNFGGAMVEGTIRQVDPDVPFREVKASRGKIVRAEPVAALFEPRVDKARMIGAFPDLEDQLCKFNRSGYEGERSPDRADAMVWALTHLMIEGDGPQFGWA